jgi:DNA-directed RNA polymerase subunit RPC12/RpoP
MREDVTITGSYIAKDGAEVVTAEARRSYVPCPYCGEKVDVRFHMTKTRTLKHASKKRPTRILLTHSYHRCLKCKRFYSPPRMPYSGLSDGCRYTLEVRRIAEELHDKGCTLVEIRDILSKKYHVNAPTTSIHDWMSRRTVEKSL